MILTKFPVNSSNQFVHNSPQVLVLLDVLSTGDGNLDQNHFPHPFRVVTEENLKGMQLLRHALNIVKSVYPDHELDALELLLQHCYPFLDFFLLQSLLELFWVNADWECTTRDYLALELNTVWCCCQFPSRESQYCHQ